MAAATCRHTQGSKVCPYCLKCFCDAPEEYWQKFKAGAPPELVSALESIDDVVPRPFGEMLVRDGKLTAEQ
ncbi:MAG TPA: hypothetical protein PKK12_03010, partial [Candidatus Aminicenantes bacterium]|nr:hypothetical protein [Candidatus Aminicenantes bacterium]